MPFAPVPAPFRSGALLVGHGTRDAEGQREFLRTVAGVAASLPEVAVQPCYLELVEPSIEQGIERLLEQAVSRIVVAPLLLFAAGHAKRDVPRAIDAARRRFPHVEFVQASHLGCHERLLELSAERYRQAERVGGATRDAGRGGKGADPDATLLIMVGRGSLDAEALRETRRFVDLRRERTPVAMARTCFLALAQPSLAETLAEAGGLAYDAIVVQPHLLFSGELLTTVRRQVEEASDRFPWHEWRLCRHLGAEPEVVAAVVARLQLRQPPP